MRRDALPTSPSLSRGVTIPGLEHYAEDIVKKACGCFLTEKTPMTVTKTATVTVAVPDIAVSTVDATQTVTSATMFVTSVDYVTTTVTVDETVSSNPFPVSPLMPCLVWHSEIIYQPAHLGDSSSGSCNKHRNHDGRGHGINHNSDRRYRHPIGKLCSSFQWKRLCV